MPRVVLDDGCHVQPRERHCAVDVEEVYRQERRGGLASLTPAEPDPCHPQSATTNPQRAKTGGRQPGETKATQPDFSRPLTAGLASLDVPGILVSP